METLNVYTVEYDTKDSSNRFQRVIWKNFDEAYEKAKEISKIGIVTIEKFSDWYF